MDLRKWFFAGVIALGVSHSAGASTVVVIGDEWSLSDSGFSNEPDAGIFVSNLVDEFGTVIHAYSINFGYTESSLATAMSDAGATYTTGDAGFSFTLSNLNTYDAILLGGTYPSGSELDILSDYVTGGGNVYISAGTGVGGSVAEAGAWNTFLAAFGIELGTTYTGFSGSVTAAGDPLFDGVSELFINNPNGIISGAVCCTEHDVFAVWRSESGEPGEPGPTPIPLPASGLLLGGILLGGLARAIAANKPPR